MKFLLFLLGIIFFLIFFFLSKADIHKQSLLGNLFLEGNFYIFLSFFLIYVSLRKQKEKNITQEKVSFFQDIDIYTISKDFFSKYIYYIACIFLYLSLFLISQGVFEKFHFPKVFLTFNIVVLTLYFYEHKLKVFQNFLRINTLIVSLYYIILHSMYLLGFSSGFSSIDISNIIILFILFFLFLTDSKGKIFHNILSSYAIIFIFLELGVIAKYFFGQSIFSLGLLSMFFGGTFLIYTDLIRDIAVFPKKIVRSWGIVFLSLTTILFSGEILQETFWGLLCFPFLLGISYILYLFHYQFQNYLAFFFSFFSIILFLFGNYHYVFFTQQEGKMALGFCFFLSCLILLFEKYNYIKYSFDKYFLSSLSILVNVIGFISFLIFYDISILSLGIVLLIESLFFFYIYYNTRIGLNTPLNTLK